MFDKKIKKNKNKNKKKNFLCRNDTVSKESLSLIITYQHSYFFGTQVHTPWFFCRCDTGIDPIPN